MSSVLRLAKSAELPAAPVVIIEDDTDLRLVLREIFEAEGFAVEAAANVTDARQLLARVRPALVLLDLHMNGESSESLLAELSSVTNPQATVVFSGTKRSDDAAAGYGVLFISKPFDLDALMNRVRRALSEGLQLLERAPRRQSSSGRYISGVHNTAAPNGARARLAALG